MWPKASSLPKVAARTYATAVEAAGIGLLNEGDKVTFDVQPDARGSKAISLKAA